MPYTAVQHIHTSALQLLPRNQSLLWWLRTANNVSITYVEMHCVLQSIDAAGANRDVHAHRQDACVASKGTKHCSAVNLQHVQHLCSPSIMAPFAFVSRLCNLTLACQAPQCAGACPQSAQILLSAAGIYDHATTLSYKRCHVYDQHCFAIQQESMHSIILPQRKVHVRSTVGKASWQDCKLRMPQCKAARWPVGKPFCSQDTNVCQILAEWKAG